MTEQSTNEEIKGEAETKANGLMGGGLGGLMRLMEFCQQREVSPMQEAFEP